MRLSQIRRTIVLAAAVSATGLAAAGPSAAQTPVGDPSHYGEWVADVELPAVEYRSRYQLKLDQSRQLAGRGAGG